MILTKGEVQNVLSFKKDTDEFCLYELPLGKTDRTRCQERTYYRCFNEISKKMWYTLEETKQAVMKWIFWIKHIKMSWIEFEIAVINSTTQLNREQATLLIQSLIEFAKKLWCGEIITPRELRDLFYNN